MPSPQHYSCRIVPTGDKVQWNYFFLIPEDGSPKKRISVSAGAEAFLLHGIISRQPEIIIKVEAKGDHPVLFLEAAPAFAHEMEFPNEHSTKGVNVSRENRSNAQVPELPETEPFLGDCKVEMGPKAVKNHHPVYHFVGYVRS